MKLERGPAGFVLAWAQRLLGVWLLILLVPVLAQAQRAGVPEDWSHRHLIFSNPGDFNDAVRSQSVDSWWGLVNDPRFQFQQARRSRAATSSRSAVAVNEELAVRDSQDQDGREWRQDVPDRDGPDRQGEARLRRPRALHPDWSKTLGTNGKVAGHMYPAKYSFAITTASCTNDFVVFPTGLAGVAGGQATIAAFSNLYVTTCSSTVPSTFWAYNTGVGATIVTSPAFSVDGTQVAFVQSTASVASLVLLKWSSTVSVGTVAAATSPTSVTLANYRTCTAPCMTVMTFNGSPNDTNSSPFVDYAADIIYVGDDAGKLHKFTGVFSGTPAEVVVTFPVTVSSGNKLTSPVKDSGTSGKIFVGNGGTAGQLHSVTTAGVVVNSATRATDTLGIIDAPIVDSTTQKVYVSVGYDGTGGGIYQFAAGFAAANGGIKATLGSGAVGTTMFNGTFDDTYFTGPGTTGNFWVCAYRTTGTAPVLYSIAMNSTFTGTVTNRGNLTSGAGTCSPVTEIRNGTHDYIFLSVSALGTATGCAGACIYSFDVLSGTPGTAVAGLAATGGTSGIIIDNNAAVTGASQIYFTPLTGSTGAVQASQALLN